MQTFKTQAENETGPHDSLPVKSLQRLEDLGQAIGDNIDAAIWDRVMPEVVTAWLASLPGQSLPGARLVLDPKLVEEAVSNMFSAAGMEPCPALTWLSADAQALALQVQHLAGTELVRLRLEPVCDNACAKFHLDNVTARLICTYRGPGTVLGRSKCPEEPLASVPTGAPIILKGSQWQSERRPELLHRSPQIAGTGISRLVLVLEGCAEEDIFPAYDQLYHGDAA